jgi:DNA adenine methylase
MRLPPLIPWPGGKNRMSARLIKMMPPHDTYVEAFAGGASVFWAKPFAKKNVIADADPWVIKLYKDVKAGRYSECEGGIKASKGLFGRSEKRKQACYKMARAVLSYHGDRSTYGARSKEGKLLYATKLQKLPCYRGKLKRATIVKGDFAKVARKHDGCNTVHFWDPPWPLDYSDKYHAHGGAKKGKSRSKDAFGKAMDPEHVAKVGGKLKGTVIVIYNWTPALARTFRKHGFTVKKISATTQHGRGGIVRRPNMVAIKRSRCGRRR